MRGFLWFLAFIFVALIGAFIAAPGEKADALFREVQIRWTEDGLSGLGEGATDGSIAELFADRVRELGAYVDAQIDEEMATIDKIQSGEIRIGGAARTAPASAPPLTQTDATPKTARTPEIVKTEPSVASMPAVAATPSLHAPAQAAPAAQPPAAQTIVPQGAETRQTPQTEDMFSSIVSHQDRPDQAAKTEFWTEERIQEAIENGEPTSGGKRACLFACD